MEHRLTGPQANLRIPLAYLIKARKLNNSTIRQYILEYKNQGH